MDGMDTAHNINNTYYIVHNTHVHWVWVREIVIILYDGRGWESGVKKPSDSISFLTNTKMGIVIKKLFMKLLLSILNSKQLKKFKAINC